MLPEPENVWRRQFMLNRLSVPMRMPRGHFLEAVRACRFGRSAQVLTLFEYSLSYCCDGNAQLKGVRQANACRARLPRDGREPCIIALPHLGRMFPAVPGIFPTTVAWVSPLQSKHILLRIPVAVQ